MAEFYTNLPPKDKDELQKYNIQEEDIVKYRENSRWDYMNGVDTISKEE